MTRSLNIPKFHTKDFTVLVASMVPISVLINYFLFGASYFSSIGQFAWITLPTFLFTGSAFLTYGFVAILLRNRFPNDAETFKRLLICLGIFFLMSAVYMSLLLLVYDSFDFYGYEYRETDFLKGYIALMVINIFLTFLNEGISRFEKYSVTIKETEQLKKEYMHSQLLGLKSQMNPHFLFNCLNTLSSLIHEDADKAEDFLDHMSKVYRYLLRNNEEQLVTVETELSFLKSYYYLLKSRHEEGLELSINVSEYVREQMIPPLTVQMLLENAMNQNSINRLLPLQIKIVSVENGLELKNTIQPKINNTETNVEVVENINNKYKLLCGCQLKIKENDKERSVLIPLIENKKLTLA